MSDTSYTDSGDDTQQRFTRDFPDPGIVRKPPDVDPGIVAPTPRDASLPRSPMAGPHPADSNWDRFLFALSGPESSFGRNQINRTSSARGWLQDIAGTRNQMIRQGLGDPWAGGRQNQFAVNRRYIERNFPQAAQAIARGDWNTAIRILAPNQWPSLPGGPQSTPQGVAMFNRALQRGPPQAFLGNPYPASPSDYGQPDSILKTAQSTPGLGPPGYMPQPNELTGVLQQAMSGLMQNGSGRIAPMSLATLQFYANYLIAQRKGQSEAAKIQHVRFQDQFKETLDAQQIELGRMGSCFSEAEKTKDPIGEFKQCMAAYSDSPNDPALQRALQGPNSWAQVKALLDWRHDNWLKGSKVKSQSDKQAQQDQQNWGIDNQSPTDGDAASPAPATPAAPSPDPAQQAPQTTSPPPTVPSQGARRSASPNPADTAAVNIAMGQTPSDAAPKDIAPEAQRRARLLEGGIDAILNDPSIPADQIVPRVSALNPLLGSDLQDVIDGSRALPQRGGSGVTTPYTGRISALARRATNNQWNPTNAPNIGRFNDPNGRVQLTMQRAGSTYAAGMQVMEDLNNLPPGTTDSQLQAALTTWLSTKAGDYRVTRLFNDWANYAREVNTLIHGGTGSVTEAQQTQNFVPEYYGTVSQYRAVVSSDAGIADAKIDAFTRTWNSLGGKGLPIPMTPRIANGINALTRVDPETGRLRGSKSGFTVGQIYTFKDGTTHVFTGAGDPNKTNDTANWQAY